MISRRDFLRVAKIGLLGFLFPKLSTQRIDMQIGDILVKLAKGEKLNDFEMQNLRLFGNQTELNNQFITSIQDGSGIIKAKNISADSSSFLFSPLDVTYLKFYTNQTVGAGAAYDIQWDELKLESKFFKWVSTDNTTISIKKPNEKLSFFVAGNIGFTNPPTTARRIDVRTYDSSDSLLSTATAISTTSDYVNSFFNPFSLGEDDNWDHFRISVRSFDAGSMELNYGKVFIMRFF